MIPDTMIPDTYLDPSDIREDGRVGFRITSMAFADLERLPAKRIEEAYQIRKFYRKSSLARLKEIFRQKTDPALFAGLEDVGHRKDVLRLRRTDIENCRAQRRRHLARS